jgi:hypothetical protein
MPKRATWGSFQRLDGKDVKLGKLISSLTAKRVYYLSHLETMAE